ncbi:MAG: SxtJ family membrane protein [Nitrospirota bacterium]|nr:SxtJ family membrane protein [Nitrospirota bacterium]
MQGIIEKKELRNFGLLVGGAFCLIGIWPAIRHGEELRLWALVPGALLIPLGLTAPTVLAPLFKGWMRVGHVMGWINTRIILGVLYFGLITPMGVVMRLFGWDAMRRALSKDALSYRVVRQARPRDHMTRQF